MSKYVIIAGGVISGCGKGVAAASVGLLMKQRGFKVQIAKFDPYLNINAGILAPREHGECFLCDDGTETDLDLGHYSRIAGIAVSAENICTSGTLYKELITEQEEGKWLGNTIQIVPHITDKIQARFEKLGEDNDVVIIEIGGTVGDIESGHFYEAVRQFKQKHGSDDVIIIMVAPILWVDTIQEFKTKPLQNSVKDLQRYGLQPDILLCRVNKELPEGILDKVSNLTNVPRQNVFDAPDVSSIYRVPIAMYDRHVDDLIVDKFRLRRNACRIYKYRDLVEKPLSDKIIKVGVFGKYDNCNEAYMSLKEAVHHAGLNCEIKAEIVWFNAEDIEKNWSLLDEISIDCAIIPGGFDSRGVEGKIKVLEWTRTHNIPTLGICLGLQCMVIEYARNVLGLKEANSLEFNKNAVYPVVHFVKGQENLTKKSATMRLGAYDCELSKNTLAHAAYGKKLISERHRHRYEVNADYVDKLNQHGFVVSGRNPESNLVEIMEIARLDDWSHPFYLGTQAHPEFKSKLMEPAPLFKHLIATTVTKKYGNL